MSDLLFENTKITAYFLWECTNCPNALSLWYCAEDVAAYFEKMNYLHPSLIREIMNEQPHNVRRISFIRHIAFRIYVYTQNENKLDNWFSAESLLGNDEWIMAICAIAKIYHDNKENFSRLTGIRSEQVRQYYQDV